MNVRIIGSSGRYLCAVCNPEQGKFKWVSSYYRNEAFNFETRERAEESLHLMQKIDPTAYVEIEH